MTRGALEYPLVVVVGGGGVGKTTLAAALALESARRGTDTLVMTFDPSRRLKDALGIADETGDREVPVGAATRGRLDASLLDARATFDRLVLRYAPDRAAAQRIFRNRFYHHLAGSLAGILEYMAVERLFEVAAQGRYGCVVLDTPPTRQALEFIQAPERMVGFLESGALRIALKPWFAPGMKGGLRLAQRGLAALLDRVIGIALLRDIAEFFQAFGPLYEGFRTRAVQVGELLRSPQTIFVLVSAPGEERVADTLYFARRLTEAGHHLGPIVVNQVHPAVGAVPARRKRSPEAEEGLRLLGFLAEHDRRGVAALRGLLSPGEPLVELPLLPEPPTSLAGLGALGAVLRERLTTAGPSCRAAV
jgi:anion-transporting  ArsA/GET3 family ATPase